MATQHEPAHDATDEAFWDWRPHHSNELQALHHLLDGQRRIARQLTRTDHRLETFMADLQTALTDLTSSVDSAVTALGASTQPLKDALAAAQQQLADLAVQDDADKAALQQSLTEAQTAADGVEAQASRLSDAVSAAQPSA